MYQRNFERYSKRQGNNIFQRIKYIFLPREDLLAKKVCVIVTETAANRRKVKSLKTTSECMDQRESALQAHLWPSWVNADVISLSLQERKGDSSPGMIHEEVLDPFTPLANVHTGEDFRRINYPKQRPA